MLQFNQTLHAVNSRLKSASQLQKEQIKNCLFADNFVTR